MENNAYILIFKESAVSQLKRKNFTNNQRLPFYQALSKITKELVETIDDENGKNDIIQFKDLGSFRNINFNESKNVFGELRGALK